MRYFLSVFVLITGLVVNCPAADSYELDLAILKERKEKAEMEALATVYEKYGKALETLLQKAEKSGDHSTVVNIKAEMNTIPLYLRLKKPKPKSADELKELIDRTVWFIVYDHEAGDPSKKGTMTFSKEGTLTHGNGQKGALEFRGARSIKLWNYDPAEFNESFTQFRAKGAQGMYTGYFEKVKE